VLFNLQVLSIGCQGPGHSVLLMRLSLRTEAGGFQGNALNHQNIYIY